MTTGTKPHRGPTTWKATNLSPIRMQCRQTMMLSSSMWSSPATTARTTCRLPTARPARRESISASLPYSAAMRCCLLPPRHPTPSLKAQPSRASRLLDCGTWLPPTPRYTVAARWRAKRMRPVKPPMTVSTSPTTPSSLWSTAVAAINGTRTAPAPTASKATSWCTTRMATSSFLSSPATMARTPWR